MRQIQITITPRFLERLFFILIILVLGFLLFQKYTADQACVPEDNMDVPKDTSASPVDNNDTTDTTTEKKEEEDTTDSGTDTTDESSTDTDDTDDTDTTDEETEPTDSGSGLSGELEVELGNIDFEIQDSGAAKINNIKVSVKNGLEDDVKLFATINITEPGNTDIDSTNPYWNEEEMNIVKSGETKLVTVQPSKSYPVGVEDGDDIVITGVFTNFQNTISDSDQLSQTV